MRVANGSVDCTTLISYTAAVREFGPKRRNAARIPSLQNSRLALFRPTGARGGTTAPRCDACRSLSVGRASVTATSAQITMA